MTDSKKETTKNSMEELRKSLDPHSAIHQAVNNIIKFQDTLNSIKPLHTPMLTIDTFKNPIDETNQKLANMEKHISDMRDIAIESAQTTNSLNASVAEFIAKFEQAVISSENSTNKAICFSIIAVALSLIVQISYNEFLVSPRSTKDAQGAISIITDKIADLKNFDNLVVSKLEEIRKLLAKK